MNYSNTNMDPSALFGGLFAIYGLFIVICMIISLLVVVFLIICNWKIFTKAGEEGWKAIIPFYNTWVFAKLVANNNVLVFILCCGSFIAFIPVIGWILSLAGLVGAVMLDLGLAKVFGKETWFGVLMIFFPYVMVPIIAFGSAVYDPSKKIM